MATARIVEPEVVTIDGQFNGTNAGPANRSGLSTAEHPTQLSTTISSLPYELISRIFAVYAVEFELLFDLSWTKLMLVCRRWHNIGLSDCALWGFIDASDPKTLKRTRIQLDRSGDTPLTVHIASFDIDVSASIPVFLQHAERICELHLAFHVVPVLVFANMLSRHSFPLLRSLQLDPSYLWLAAPEELSTTLPVATFKGAMPKLTTLDVSEFTLSWGLLRGLQSLSLTRAHDTGATPTFTKLLSVLDASPSLAYLKLHAVIPSPTPSEDYAVVPLPFLQSLRLKDRLEECSELFRHITISLDTRVSVTATSTIYNNTDTNLLVDLGNHIRGSSAPMVQCVQVTTPGVTFGATPLTVRTFTDISQPDTGKCHAAIFRLTVRPGTDNVLDRVMAQIFGALPCATITQLYCRMAARITVASWKILVPCLPALETVYTFPDGGGERLFNALIEFSEAQGGEMFPPLRHIRLLTYQWTRGIPIHYEMQITRRALAALSKLLGLRHARGKPIEVLEIDVQPEPLNVGPDEWNGLVGRIVQHEDFVEDR
ncbi:hypothetical protein FB451DRAFT_1535275 [Mycena latifolia]|nr:hypothetical protein FB451DRAFT_1535275 [Mycena latifolia]